MSCFTNASYISCGVNKSPNILDWGENNLICFGVCNAVAIYDPLVCRTVTTLSHHKDKVNAVKWISGNLSAPNKLVSVSSDCSVIVWQRLSADNIIFEPLTVLKGHEGSVQSVDAKYKNDEEIIIASGDSYSTVRIWLGKVEEEIINFELIKVVDLGRRLPLCLDLLALKHVDSCLLAIGTDTPEISLHLVGDNTEKVHHLTNIIGHEDWIRTISMKKLINNDIFIASAGQDNVVRILRLTETNNDIGNDAFYMNKKDLLLGGTKYYLNLETVLFGHEGWIYGVDWSKLSDSGEEICLLTTSFDRTAVIWKPCPDSGVWIEESKMGELGGDNSLGYYGGKFSPDGNSIIVHSYQGSFHIWHKENGKWLANFAASGHSDAVSDISWDKEGNYLLSVSADKTTRLHGEGLKKDSSSKNGWCEVSRPQIHGHGLSSIASVKSSVFASCSEEKVTRVFEMPDLVLKLMNKFCSYDFLTSTSNGSNVPSTASITALGLSNTAVYGNGESVAVQTLASNELIETCSLNEDFLIQNTLWPESMKLYGHGNDVFTVAASRDGTLLATAAKASNADQAKILLWNTETWKIVETLEGHQLTITQLEFSPSDTYLLSVSRDREWRLFKRNENHFEPYAKSGKGLHSRIIWSCSWSHDELYFVTGSRDGKAIVWNDGKPVNHIDSVKGSITAVAFGPVNITENGYIIALGHECGDISLYHWTTEKWLFLCTVPKFVCHHLIVNRLQFRPISPENSTLQLASCSSDYSVRIFEFSLDILREKIK